MNSNKFVILFFMFFMTWSMSSYAQRGIRFYQLSVKQGIEKAKAEGKFLFVDTYAEWCIPCKRMKRVFADKKVSHYFNQNYVNIKIDMDGLNGKTTYNDYDVVFLPTMMIFDHEGEIKYKTDKLLTAEELLSIGEQANVEGVYLGNNASQIMSSPFETTFNKVKPKTVPVEVASAPKKSIPTAQEEGQKESNSKGQIVKIIGVNDVMPPEVLYQEAYYQMQLMNDRQGEAAIAYLKTQEDWGTKKNVKFIYDFVESTNSMLFDYIKENRDHVASIVGEFNLSHSLDILVNQKIYQGFPRPNLMEAIELYKLVDPLTAEQSAYQYYIGRMQQEGNSKGYLLTLNKYLANVAPNDHIALNRAVESYIAMEFDQATWNGYKDKIKKAIKLNPTEARYHITLAKIYLLKNDRRKAKNAIEDALEIMNENTGDLDSEISEILNRIGKS